MKLCIKILRFLFPKSEKERMDYRHCMAFISAHLEDISYNSKQAVKKDAK